MAANDVAVREVLEHTEAYVRAFNSHDPSAVDRLYAEDGISVWEKGNAVGGARRREELAAFLARKPVMTIEVLEQYVVSDAALLVVDWSIDIPGVDGGAAERHAGIGLDVLRRGTDGQWLFAIDNPYGKEL
ncbi:YybH family protein [Streptomyces sp. L500]